VYVDAACPRDLRATAQNLFAFVAGGIAMPLGLLLTQPLVRRCTDPLTREINFGPVFGIPTLFLCLILAGFWKWFGVSDGEIANLTPNSDVAKR
jgi:hypothetical protein